ncbi:MAG: L-aspartate oxidase [Ottowia sp.]|uniref:L-aspartate oxidase n=1 Tax=Ottowia sp. TaxID=1898956 RepID=UPI003C7926B8
MKSSGPQEGEVQAVDVLIVGSGLAGLSAALQLAPRHRVAVLTKESLGDGASAQAQGGIAAVLAESDSFDAHLQDTLVAGAGLSDPEATRFIVEGAPRCISWLESLGVPFTREGAALHLTREGGHSARRIVHATDATGAAVQQALVAQLRMTPGVQVFEQHMLLDLLTVPGGNGQRRCVGLRALDVATGIRRCFQASHTVLATGGAGQVYRHTTNPKAATGDGIAAATRAGCRVANMEFIQFHPTSLHHPQANSFLISEAVRGEGGLLRLPAQAGGERFMPAHDARAELAPRDIVSRAIDLEMKRHGLDCVELDISHLPPGQILAHFPNIHARCLALGLDITRTPIPVVPAAHYTCGGVRTDLHGRTDVAGLYAIGETACTGLHGANRLASNSLLECVVLAHAAAQDITRSSPIPGWEPELAVNDHVRGGDSAAVDWALLRRSLQAAMWEDVGIVRTTAGLARAAQRLAGLRRTLAQPEVDSTAHREAAELRNLVEVASLIVSAAQSRRESRGGHFNSDYAGAMLAA